MIETIVAIVVIVLAHAIYKAGVTQGKNDGYFMGYVDGFRMGRNGRLESGKVIEFEIVKKAVKGK